MSTYMSMHMPICMPIHTSMHMSMRMPTRMSNTCVPWQDEPDAELSNVAIGELRVLRGNTLLPVVLLEPQLFGVGTFNRQYPPLR